MLLLVLSTLSLLFFLDAFSILRLHGTETGQQVLDYLQEDTGQPSAGFLYTLMGIGMVILARHQAVPIYFPLYGIGGWVSLMGVRFFEQGFARRYYLRWVFHSNPWRRRLLFGFEVVCGIYLATLAWLLAR